MPLICWQKQAKDITRFTTWSKQISWWRHQMVIFSAFLALCAGNSPVTGEFPSQGQWRGALMLSLIYAWINGWVNNREAGDLRRHRAHYDVTVMSGLHRTVKQFEHMRPTNNSVLISSNQCKWKWENLQTGGNMIIIPLLPNVIEYTSFSSRESYSSPTSILPYPIRSSVVIFYASGFGTMEILWQFYESVLWYRLDMFA